MQARTGRAARAAEWILGAATAALVLGTTAGAAGAAEPDRRAGKWSGDPDLQEPLLQLGRAALGGYMDLEFRADDTGSGFDQHRFVPSIAAEVSDRVHVAAEVEFEHGGKVAGDEETDGEISLEFATVDFRVNEGLNLRGGLILSPLGRLNVFHDAPMLDLTDRPLVDTYVIPTTLSEAGAGAFGAWYPTGSLMVDYEAYLVNGFKQEAVEGGVLNLREGRGRAKEDNNNARSVVARVGVSPRVGTGFGASIHTGSYDDAGQYNLTLAALDARFTQGPLELLGEGAMATAEYAVDTTLTSVTTMDARSAGFYVEGRYHFLAGAIRDMPQSVFTAVVRAEYVDMNREVDGQDVQRLVFGINFRPTEATVVKNDLVLDRSREVGAGDWGDTRTGYRLSLATFF